MYQLKKSGHITNMITIVLFGIVTVCFIFFGYYILTIITGVIVAVQPIILIVGSPLDRKEKCK